MKIIFLDIDGVLNSGEYLYAHNCDEWVEQIDPDAVSLLNELVADTQAQIVISSSWRIARSLSEIKNYFKERGFMGDIIDVTPSNYRGETERGNEIQEWLDTHQVDSFVILDDDSDMAHLRDYLVKTSFEHGLQPEHITKAKKILNGNH